MQRSRYFLLKECLKYMPVSVELKDLELIVDFQKLDGLKWKMRPCDIRDFRSLFAPSLENQEGIRWTLSCLSLSSDLSHRSFAWFYQVLLKIVHLLSKENLSSLDIWGQTESVFPTGFMESKAGSDLDLFEELYHDQWIVREKKALVIDLDHSVRSYIISSGRERNSIIDGAAQIASLTTGFNHVSTLPMLSRQELFDPELDLHKWDVLQAYTHFLRKESQLPYVSFVNSGSEAIEAAFLACQVKHPNRRRILAFEGSFHGRTFLALHTTHSPSKRKPFETFPELISFLPFPETKTPFGASSLSNPALEPIGWLKGWSSPSNPTFLETVLPWLISGDPLLERECQTLLKTKTEMEKGNEKPLAMIVEPMQCEGGDRYGTPRFFRALRVLTRAMDVPLIFDEVQTGFGLGGSMFWSSLFQLEKPSELSNRSNMEFSPDFPDAICLAKKAQVGVCLSAFPVKLRLETSAASLYRGYLQALQIKETDFSHLSAKVLDFLKALQSCLGPHLIQNPRALGLAFAFDLPEPNILNKLIEVRFPNGVLFYPAGEATARFRLLINSTDLEIAQIFHSLFCCFQAISDKGIIGKIPSLAEFQKKLAPDHSNWIQKCVGTSKGFELGLPWSSDRGEGGEGLPSLFPLPTSKAAFLVVTGEQWQTLFLILLKKFPQILAQSQPLEAIVSKTAADLWHRYETDSSYTYLDLLWDTSRLKGAYVERLKISHLTQIAEDIRKLEEILYEPARRDDPEYFKKLAQDDRSILFGARDPKGRLVGISVASPLSYFKDLPMIDGDPANSDANALYSVDLSVHPNHQKKGLGFRLKAEQIIEAYHQKASLIRSRNRVPEATAMIRLNRTLGGVICDENTKDYEGNGTAVYQSLTLHQHRNLLEPFYKGMNQPFVGSLRNKTSLANFISQNYLTNLLFLKAWIPPDLRHVYLSSGRAEAVDKAAKLVRFKKANAKIAFSFRGDFFGDSTAVARSLGGLSSSSYFAWPVLDPNLSASELESKLSSTHSDECLGLFLCPRDKNTGWLGEVISIFRSKQIPIFFHDSDFVSFVKKEDPVFEQSEKWRPDGLIFYLGGQLGMVCVTKEYFIEQSLMMISTWDGDEHSLNLLRMKMLNSFLD